MPTDYRGPMRTGLWWASPDEWQLRYERHIERLHKLQAECRRVDLAHQRVYQQWREVAADSKRGRYFDEQLDHLKARRKMLTEQLWAEEREIRAIEDGYHEP